MPRGERSERSDLSARVASLERQMLETEKKRKESEKERKESEKERKKSEKERREIKKEWREIKKEGREIKKELKKTSRELGELRGLSKHWSTSELVIVAGEIWKWTVRKRGAIGGDGRHLYDTDPDVQRDVQSAAKAMRMTARTEDMKAMSRICIPARNDTAHFHTIKALDAAVLNSQSALDIFPELKLSHPLQCKTIQKYERLKACLPHNFC